MPIHMKVEEVLEEIYANASMKLFVRFDRNKETKFLDKLNSITDEERRAVIIKVKKALRRRRDRYNYMLAEVKKGNVNFETTNDLEVRLKKIKTLKSKKSSRKLKSQPQDTEKNELQAKMREEMRKGIMEFLNNS